MIIDFHVHVFPDGLAQKTIPILAERSGLTPSSDGTVGCTVTKMQEAGVDKAVLQNIATNPRQMEKVNDFAISCNDREELIAFGSIHPAADYERELDRLEDAGIRGIKLHPDYQGFFIDGPGMQKVYEAILKRDFVLLFHAGVDIGLPEPVHASAEAISHTLGLFSGEKVVFAHMGGYLMYEQTMDKLIGKDVYIDTSFSFGRADGKMLHTMITAHRPDKILFATDFPWGDFAKEIAYINALDIPETLRENIFHNNAEKLLQL
ncbi:MAG: amidohydrolase family protein [Clostridia bacterium]|nr:amidohydrolase family protein [Clostridia bacterium]